eukprot:TRINITY_DN1385_c1_g1_i1.p1 TRINITY_DN1385_c1_g1~~TRINITY_DN1385_c1_g1_i1.p1  ORF type:complete len:746 (+),score=148.53 TRINITY_DN1385_c1_g1_i1:46-2283(+)
MMEEVRVEREGEEAVAVEVAGSTVRDLRLAYFTLIQGTLAAGALADDFEMANGDGEVLSDDAPYPPVVHAAVRGDLRARALLTQMGYNVDVAEGCAAHMAEAIDAYYNASDEAEAERAVQGVELLLQAGVLPPEAVVLALGQVFTAQTEAAVLEGRGAVLAAAFVRGGVDVHAGESAVHASGEWYPHPFICALGAGDADGCAAILSAAAVPLDRYYNGRTYGARVKPLMAVVQGPTDRVKAVLACLSSFGWDFSGTDGLQALEMAVDLHDAEKCAAFLAHGAGAGQSEWQAELLALAASEGDVGVLEVLIAAGVDVNARLTRRPASKMLMASEFLYPCPLWFAVGKARVQAVQYLLGRGATADFAEDSLSEDLTRLSTFARTPAVQMVRWAGLSAARGARGRDFTAIEEAHAAGVLEVNTPHLGKTALFHACRRGELDYVVQLLECGACPHAAPGAAMAAVAHREILLALHAAGCDMTQRGERGATVLMGTCAKGDADQVADCLALYRIDPLLHDAMGMTALHHCAFAADGGSACQAVLESLCDRRLADAATPTGVTPLQLAAALGKTAVVRALVKAEADVTACDAEGRTALHHAAAQGCAEVCEVLLESGAHPTARDAWGRIPLCTTLDCFCREAEQTREYEGRCAVYQERESAWNQTCDVLLQAVLDTDASALQPGAWTYYAEEALPLCRMVPEVPMAVCRALLQAAAAADPAVLDRAVGLAVERKREDLAELALDLGEVCGR